MEITLRNLGYQLSCRQQELGHLPQLPILANLGMQRKDKWRTKWHGQYFRGQRNCI